MATVRDVERFMEQLRIELNENEHIETPGRPN